MPVVEETGGDSVAHGPVGSRRKRGSCFEETKSCCPRHGGFLPERKVSLGSPHPYSFMMVPGITSNVKYSSAIAPLLSRAPTHTAPLLRVRTSHPPPPAVKLPKVPLQPQWRGGEGPHTPVP